jgi:hypothetical protein
MSSSSSSTAVVKEEKPAAVVAKPVLGVSMDNDQDGEVETVDVVDANMLALENLNKKRARSVKKDKQKEAGAGNKKNKVDLGVTIETVVVKEEKKEVVSKAVSAVAAVGVSKANTKGQGAGKGGKPKR